MLPPRCDAGEVCPDNMAGCEPQVDVGQPCQLARDDECSPPSNQAELTSSRNVNGSVCLNQICYHADVEIGQACVVENLAFVAFKTVDGKSQQYSDIRSKDNCKRGGYCDGTQRICIKTLNVGDTCSADKTCASFNCGQDNKCIPPTDGADSPPVWVYVIVGVGIIARTCTCTHRIFFLGDSRLTVLPFSSFPFTCSDPRYSDWAVLYPPTIS